MPRETSTGESTGFFPGSEKFTRKQALKLVSVIYKADTLFPDVVLGVAAREGIDTSDGLLYDSYTRSLMRVTRLVLGRSIARRTAEIIGKNIQAEDMRSIMAGIPDFDEIPLRVLNYFERNGEEA